MQNYLSQLLSDLEAAAANPPEPAWIEIPPHMEALPDAAELALVPFKPISESVAFQEEYLDLLKQFEIDFDDRYIFKPVEIDYFVPDGTN